MGIDSTDGAPSPQKSCAGCAAEPPAVDGDFALIRAGWRLTRPRDADRRQARWWCPACSERRRTKALG